MSDERPPSPSELAGLPLWMQDAPALADALDGWIQCGVDILEIDRIEHAVSRWGTRFLDRVWTVREQRICAGRPSALAARFAGKEAVAKALGTGLPSHNWLDIEILRDRMGKPLAFLHGAARERATLLGINSLAVSLSHSRTMACAMVVVYLRK
ncbi:MAG TPA: holo-ACP synthase [Chloroflexia bacterium]|nr:holo-ACP synthase [Chloroflexia bacterium]